MKEHIFSITDELHGYERFIDYILSENNDEITRRILEDSWRNFVNEQRKREDVIDSWYFVEDLCFENNNTESWIGLG